MDRQWYNTSMLSLNTKAPDFTLKDQHGNDKSLKDYEGTYVVLYFYPQDDTPGCTTEACTIRDSYTSIQKYATILGVSGDSVESHKKFAEKYNLPFTLLADTQKKVIHAYDASGIFTKRITYLIDPKGIIIKTYPKVNPSQHAAEILQDLEAIQ